MPPPASMERPYLNDGLHPPHSSLVANTYFTFDVTPTPVKFQSVSTHLHPPTVLEAVVMLLALVMLIRAGTSAIHQVVTLLLRIRIV